jgi:hypothetical protein
LVLERRTRMSTHKIGPFLGAVVILLAGITLGDWDRHQGLSGLTPLAFAQDAMGRDDKPEKDKKKKDHFACYEVKCFPEGKDKSGGPEEVRCPDEEKVVTLFNQFTEDDDDKDHRFGDDDKDRGRIVVVGRLKLLCVPTHKEHHHHDD